MSKPLLVKIPFLNTKLIEYIFFFVNNNRAIHINWKIFFILYLIF